MRKSVSSALLGGAMLAAVWVTPAAAQEAHCMPFLPDGIGCWIRCNIEYVTQGLPPGHICTQT